MSEPKNKWEVDNPSREAMISAEVSFSNTPFINIHARKTHAAPANAVRIIAAKGRSPFRNIETRFTNDLRINNASGWTERQ